jgi:DDE superfamily endonuclease/Helix-turn-helix of DDE superfamily endonuclease
MIARYAHLQQFPPVFRSLTGLLPDEFAALVAEVLPAFHAAAQQRHAYADRQRAPGGGPTFTLDGRDQVLLTVIWLRQYPIHEVLAFLFGVSDSTVSRSLARVLPLLEQAGCATMRMPDPGRKHRRSLDQLLRELPELFVVIDSFAQPVQRPPLHSDADTWYSGKKKRHTIKSQVTVDGHTGEIGDISESVKGPTADITLLKQSGVLERVPSAVGREGDLAYVGIRELPGGGLGATPRRKPRGQERSADDVAYNRAFGQRRVIVEHTIGRMRRYRAITEPDREHRAHHAARVRAIAGLVNRQLRYRDSRMAA